MRSALQVHPACMALQDVSGIHGCMHVTTTRSFQQTTTRPSRMSPACVMPHVTSTVRLLTGTDVRLLTGTDVRLFTGTDAVQRARGGGPPMCTCVRPSSRMHPACMALQASACYQDVVNDPHVTTSGPAARSSSVLPQRGPPGVRMLPERSPTSACYQNAALQVASNIQHIKPQVANLQHVKSHQPHQPVKKQHPASRHILHQPVKE